MRNREAIMAFKRECRNYFYYLADIKNLMLEIKRMDVKMAGVHAVDLTKVRIRRDPWKNRLIKYVEQSNSLQRQLQEKQEKVENIINTISRVSLPSFRVIIWMIYVQRKRIQEVADLYDYSKDYMANLIIDLMDEVFDAKIAEGSYIPPETPVDSEEDAIEDTEDTVTFS